MNTTDKFQLIKRGALIALISLTTPAIPAEPPLNRTLVEYGCAVPAGHRHLKIQWNGPTELDRVEIYHS